jgi:hypothetical protein
MARPQHCTAKLSHYKHQWAPTVAGHSALVPLVFVMWKLSSTVLGSSHSEELPTLIVIVLTPAGDALFTFENAVLCLCTGPVLVLYLYFVLYPYGTCTRIVRYSYFGAVALKECSLLLSLEYFQNCRVLTTLKIIPHSSILVAEIQAYECWA